MPQLNLDLVSGQKHSLISMIKISRDTIHKDVVVHISQIFEIDCLGDQDPGHVTAHICQNVSAAQQGNKTKHFVKIFSFKNN